MVHIHPLSIPCVVDRFETEIRRLWALLSTLLTKLSKPGAILIFGASTTTTWQQGPGCQVGSFFLFAFIMLGLSLFVLAAVVRSLNGKTDASHAATSWTDFAGQMTGETPEITALPIIAHYRKHNAIRTDNTLAYLTMLMLMFDTEPNPGPTETTEYPCGTCEMPVDWEERGVMCDSCQQWYHASCQQIHTTETWMTQTNLGTARYVACETYHPHYSPQMTHRQQRQSLGQNGHHLGHQWLCPHHYHLGTKNTQERNTPCVYFS